MRDGDSVSSVCQDEALMKPYAVTLLALFALAGCPAETQDDLEDAFRDRRDGGPFDAPLPDSVLVPMCPPRAPFGTAVGDTTEDITFFDCAGAPHTLHELCDRQAVWVYQFAEWCEPCQAFVRTHVNAIYEAKRAAYGEQFEAWVVISENSTQGQPDAAFCNTVRDRYGLRMPVLYDPTGAFQRTFQVVPNEMNLVLSDESRIEFIGPLTSTQVSSQIDRAMNR